MSTNHPPSGEGARADTRHVPRADRPRHHRDRRPRAIALGIVLSVALVALALYALRLGSMGRLDTAECVRGMLAVLGLEEPLEGHAQTFLELHLWRVLVTIGVGAALSLSGGLLQGVFRNALASPSILGLSSGAMVGAAVAVLIVGGHGPIGVSERVAGFGPVFVTLCGFGGALATALVVTAIATRGGRVSVPTLLLVGIAVNACLGGVLAAIQSLSLREDFGISRAIFAWTFGTLQDRSPTHVALVWGGFALAAAVIPFVAFELDLFAGGEEDAQALGVNTALVKLAALVAAALAAGAAVAVAGQIAFVGLIVPHLLRLTTGVSHRTLLPLCPLAGGVFLLGADSLQRALLGASALPPGVTMSLVGGPFFLFLLVRYRNEVRAW